MKTEKLFTVAGVSTNEYGETKIRFTTNLEQRYKNLLKHNHNDIFLIEMDAPMTKGEICKVLLDHDEFQDEDAQMAITEYVVNNCKAIAKELDLSLDNFLY